jgi:glycosyltransferase involved in cell wall biosynthesis
MLSGIPSVILTNSSEARRFHVGLGYRASGWEVIPNGLDPEQFRPDPAARHRLLGELGLHEAPFLIGLIARFDPMKDHSTFVRAACRMLERGRDVHFVLAGRGVCRENPGMSAMIPEKWAERFHLLGERRDIERVTAGLSVASLASLGEGFPNVVCEAMSCGVPCVVMDVGDAASLVGETGAVVPPGDPSALADAWDRLMAMPEEARAGLGEAARKRVRDLYDIRVISKRYESLYLGMARS